MSANTGFAPQYRTQLDEAAKVMELTITSSPSPKPAVKAARCSAAVPLLTTTACFAPVILWAAGDQVAGQCGDYRLYVVLLYALSAVEYFRFPDGSPAEYC